jgi:hypothetical protein
MEVLETMRVDNIWYKRYGLEIFAFKKYQPMMEYIQNNCHIFSDKEYTSEEMKLDYLKDIETDESKLMRQ